MSDSAQFHGMYHWLTSWSPQSTSESRIEHAVTNAKSEVANGSQAGKRFKLPDLEYKLKGVYKVATAVRCTSEAHRLTGLHEFASSRKDCIISASYQKREGRGIVTHGRHYFCVRFTETTAVVFNPSCFGETEIDLGVSSSKIHGICTNALLTKNLYHLRLIHIGAPTGRAPELPGASNRARSRSPVDIGRGAQASRPAGAQAYIDPFGAVGNPFDADWLDWLDRSGGGGSGPLDIDALFGDDGELNWLDK